MSPPDILRSEVVDGNTWRGLGNGRKTPTVWLSPKSWAWLLFAALVLLSARSIVSATYRGVLLTAESPLLYNAATLGFSYLEFGFVRRGLGGTLVALLGPNKLLATAIFHLMSATALAGLACWLFVHSRRSLLAKIVPGLLLLALMARWGEDPGRTDLSVAALMAFSTILLLRKRIVSASVCIAAGLAIHETAFVFGIPLLLGLIADEQRWRGVPARDAVAAGAVLLVALALYAVVDKLPHADARSMIDGVRSRLPSAPLVDWAVYFALAGGRGLKTAMCQNALDPSYGLHVASGLLVIASTVGLLSDRGARFAPFALLVSIPPFLFLSYVANDISRWTVLASFNVLLLWMARSPHTPPPSEKSSLPWLRMAAALLIMVLIHPRVGRIPYPIYSPLPTLDRAVLPLTGERPLNIAERCDPHWHSLLDSDPPVVIRP